MRDILLSVSTCTSKRMKGENDAAMPILLALAELLLQLGAPLKLLGARRLPPWLPFARQGLTRRFLVEHARSAHACTLSPRCHDNFLATYFASIWR